MRKVHYTVSRASDKANRERQNYGIFKRRAAEIKGRRGRVAISFISNEIISFRGCLGGTSRPPPAPKRTAGERGKT